MDSAARHGGGRRCSPGAAAAPDRIAPRIRPSKAGKWRALSLLLVHALVAVHIAHWMREGSTFTPLEPSEAMEFCKDGVLNAGLIFFGLTIASTFLLGRWFCGWACHIVALQDLCRWLLLKLGLRPRPAVLGVLGWVPWLAFTYMFLSPLARRLFEGDGLGVNTVHLTTQDFWRTFPGPAVAVLTFLVCGFAIVWLLGSKGFCTYGCPYGAVFGIADQLAPLRIRVTDACDACGHCTAVCSSNVNVSQEVRDYGAVVDPGCMKCLDCVSVCPRDALFLGFGRPALFTAPRRVLARTRSLVDARMLVQAVFVFACFAVFHGFNGQVNAYLNPVDWQLVGLEGSAALAVGLVFRGKARRTTELSLPEEALLGVLFLIAMLTFRGHGWVPFLFALGLSGTAAYSALSGLRLLYQRDLTLQRLRLKAGGRWRPSGMLFGAACAILVGGWVVVGAHQVEQTRAARMSLVQESSARRAQRKKASELFDEGLRAAGEERFEDAIAAFRAVLGVRPDWMAARKNLAVALCAAGRFEEGLAELEQLLSQRPRDVRARALAAQACLSLGEARAAVEHLREGLRLSPGDAELERSLAQALQVAETASAETAAPPGER